VSGGVGVPVAGAPAPLRVLGIAGSVRRGSFNRALLEAARELAPAEMSLSIHDLEPLPLFRPETEPPPEVRALLSAIDAADALLVATPEYNYGVPAVLCSALEWASQPPASSVLRGKPAAVMGASTGRGGSVRAQLQLRQVFLYTGVRALLQPELMVDRACDRFSADGRLVDAPLRERLGWLLAELAEWTRLLAGPEPRAAAPAPAVRFAPAHGNGAPPLHAAAGVVQLQG
jgi:chromate reductase, NAD(P)H dehydrogenase (quinone)